MDNREAAVGSFKEHRDGFLVEQFWIFQALFSFDCKLGLGADFYTYLYLPLNSVTFFSSLIVKWMQEL